VWRPRPGARVDLDPGDPYRLTVADDRGHRYSLDVWAAALDDRPVARALQAAILDGLCPTCSLGWEARALMQRHILPRVRDRAPALLFAHAESCPACPTQEGP
jgi:hypothetical protein